MGIREKRLKKFTQDKDFSEKKKFTFNKNAKPESPKEDDIPKKFTFSAKEKAGDLNPIPCSSSQSVKTKLNKDKDSSQKKNFFSEYMNKNDKSESPRKEEKKSKKFTFSANPKVDSSGNSSSEEIKFIEDNDSRKKNKFTFNKHAQKVII